MKRKPQSPATRQTLNFGIMGYGRLAREYYAPALACMKDVTVAAVADPLEQSRLAASRWKPLARVYENHLQMLRQEELDAVLIASPPSFHLSGWLEARKYGLPAFVEKPFALISQVEELPHLSDAEAALMVNFNRRFWPPYRRVIEAAKNGAIGSLRAIQFTFQTDVRRWSTVTTHRLSLAEGGVLHDLGSQAVDLVCQIADCDPSGISASFTSRRWEADCVRLELEFPGGISARCDLSYGAPNRESLTVHGSTASILLHEPNMTPHTTKRNRLSPAMRIEDYAWLGYRALFPRHRMLRSTIAEALRAFAETIRTGHQFRPGYSDACANLRLLALASGVSGATVASGGANG
ncbi:MAG: Gfo/Idh/MocA family oxidoreductase [Terriglobales bacterium]